jgi:pimeloyl-ACP methyl ester carboxylesterase
MVKRQMLVQGAIAVFLITLGLGQLAATHWRLRGASLVGSSRWAGYGVGLGLLAGGGLIIPATFTVLLWTPLAGVLAVSILLLGRPVQISDGDDLMPGYLLTPHLPQLSLKGKEKTHEAAVCVVPGAGDTKTSFKWRLVQALLAEGLTILTIDPHGHGDYGHRPLVYPDCLAVIPAAVQFLRAQPGISRVGLAGISLGGALAIKALAEQSNLGHRLVEALVVLETPVELNYSDSLFYREFWNTIYRAPVLSLLREITLRQIRESWYSGGYRSRHNTSELFRLLNPLENIGRLKDIPILLVYSRRDLIASASQAQAMQQAAPQATFIESKKASHVTLTLIPEINRQVANWLKAQLGQ